MAILSTVLTMVKYIDSIVYEQFKDLMRRAGGWIPEIAMLEGVDHLIIGHNAMWKRYWIREEMNKEGKEGKLHVDIYANNIDAWHTNNKKLDLPKYGANIWWVVNKQNFLKKKITERGAAARAALYMDTFEEEKIKVKFQANNKEYRFSYNARFSIKIPKESLEGLLEKGFLEKF